MAKKIKTTKIENETEHWREVLLKKALGYKVTETTDEYARTDNDLVLTKRKVSVKYFPPDLQALQLLHEYDGVLDDYSKLTDEQLEQEKQKLLEQLQNNQESDDENE